MILLQQCFDALKITRADAPLEEKKEQNCHHKAAGLLLLQMAQNETLGKIISEMRDNKLTFEQSLFNMPKNERPHCLVQLLKFIPFLENDHLLKIGGRLQFHEFSSTFQHPVLLPYRHWTTELYVRKKHVKCGHLGAHFVVGALQQDYELRPIGGVTTVRHYITDCVGCKIRRRVRGEQLIAPLPSVRLKPRTHVFAYVASNLAGPFSVVVGWSHVKRWLFVFMCMITTAVRIEIAADLTSSSFINAFRRFLCSAGFRTRYIRTDNGTTT